MANTQQLSLGRNLFIATPKAIYFRPPLSEKTLFECETAGGIANARASKDNSGLFAVADGQVVLLHDASRGRDRKYQLKNSDDEPRLLLFSPDSRTLYFTTSLSSSVQAYSIPTAELLPSLPSHPSPPNTIAISSNGIVLLSASPDPATIHLQDRRWGGSAAVNFCPRDARSAATCAAFQQFNGPAQPAYTNFVIGFQDGMLAMYRLFLPSLRKRYAEPHQTHFFTLQPVRVGAMKKIHKAAMGGVTAAEFVPGYKSRVVSIGHDGKCRLHVSSPATCLSVSAQEPILSNGRGDGTVLLGGDAAEDAGQVYEGCETLIAIGTQAGKVLVFNILGLLIHEVTMEVPITAVEWVGDMSAPSVLPNRVLSLPPDPHPAVDTPMEGFLDYSEEETGTVKKTVLPQRRTVTRKPVPVQQPRDLFSDERPRRTSDVPGRRRPYVLNGSPLRVTKQRERPMRRSLMRPRISTETFMSPSGPSPHKSVPTSPDPPIQEVRRWPQVHQAPSVPPASNARCFSVPHSSSFLSEDSDWSGQEWFTPPSTRRNRGKASQRHVVPGPSVTA
ncbi:hypothetical protein BDW02DRAFT_479403, partial [Decorospora gaudefroyi]